MNTHDLITCPLCNTEFKMKDFLIHIDNEHEEIPWTDKFKILEKYFIPVERITPEISGMPITLEMSFIGSLVIMEPRIELHLDPPSPDKIPFYGNEIPMLRGGFTTSLCGTEITTISYYNK